MRTDGVAATACDVWRSRASTSWRCFGERFFRPSPAMLMRSPCESDGASPRPRHGVTSSRRYTRRSCGTSARRGGGERLNLFNFGEVERHGRKIPGGVAAVFDLTAMGNEIGKGSKISVRPALDEVTVMARRVEMPFHAQAAGEHQREDLDETGAPVRRALIGAAALLADADQTRASQHLIELAEIIKHQARPRWEPAPRHEPAAQGVGLPIAWNPAQLLFHADQRVLERTSVENEIHWIDAAEPADGA